MEDGVDRSQRWGRGSIIRGVIFGCGGLRVKLGQDWGWAWNWRGGLDFWFIIKFGSVWFFS